jgi:hypothetical protein
MSARLPINPTPDTFVTTRVPRTKKFFLGERRMIPFKVPEQRGVDTEWVCSKVMIYKPDGNIDTINNGEDGLSEPIDGLMMAAVDLIQEGMWLIEFYFGPEDESESFKYRVRVRVVA